MTNSSPLRWLITGASAGFGRIFAEAALRGGDHVVATARNPDRVADLAAAHPDRAQALRLDVTDPEQVAAAVAAATAAGPIDVLVNNAGHGMIGALEEVSDAQLRETLETNLIGTLAVTRAVLPHLRARRRGHVVFMSSVGGVVANPGHALYNVSKFALEGAAEALAGEVGPLGIGVTIVEPGPFRTEFAGRSAGMADPIADYAETPAGALRARFRDQDGVQPGDPELAVQAIMSVVRSGAGPLRLPLGRAAVDRIRAKLRSQLTDLEAVAELAVGTDRPPPPTSTPVRL